VLFLELWWGFYTFWQTLSTLHSNSSVIFWAFDIFLISKNALTFPYGSFFMALGFELRAESLLGRHSTTWYMPPQFTFQVGLLPRVGCEPQSSLLCSWAAGINGMSYCIWPHLTFFFFYEILSRVDLYRWLLNCHTGSSINTKTPFPVTPSPPTLASGNRWAPALTLPLWDGITDGTIRMWPWRAAFSLSTTASRHTEAGGCVRRVPSHRQCSIETWHGSLTQLCAEGR
jgi:hypothetical protein